MKPVLLTLSLSLALLVAGPARAQLSTTTTCRYTLSGDVMCQSDGLSLPEQYLPYLQYPWPAPNPGRSLWHGLDAIDVNRSFEDARRARQEEADLERAHLENELLGLKLKLLQQEIIERLRGE